MPRAATKPRKMPKSPRKFTPEEDALIIKSVAQGVPFAHILPDRMGQHVSQRWRRLCESPSSFTKAEDATILRGIVKGTCIRNIKLRGRNQRQVESRWNELRAKPEIEALLYDGTPKNLCFVDELENSLF